jgi:hypothetical protein
MSGNVGYLISRLILIIVSAGLGIVMAYVIHKSSNQLIDWKIAPFLIALAWGIVFVRALWDKSEGKLSGPRPCMTAQIRILRNNYQAEFDSGLIGLAAGASGILFALIYADVFSWELCIVIFWGGARLAASLLLSA